MDDGPARKPNFLIPGAARSGTSFLYSLLRQHPDVYMPALKEPRYFADRYALGERWYLELFEGVGPQTAIGEASTKYMYTPEFAERIWQFNPNMRLIFILRNPIERAWSNYTREIQTRGEHRRIRDTGHRYLSPGMYSKHLKRFLQYWSMENILVFRSEDLYLEPNKAVREVLRWLGVEREEHIDISKGSRNESKMPVSLTLQRFIYRNLQFDAGDPLPWRYLRAGSGLVLNRLNHGYSWRSVPTLDPETETWLRESFRHEIEELETMLGWDLAAWKGETRHE